MKRREFITLLGGTAAAWPLAARAQQPEKMRRIGMLLPAAPDDSEVQSWVGAFLQGLAQSGWITGRNIRIETRWTKFDPEDTRKYAAELVALAPDAILATGNSTVGPLLRMTRTVPIVFPLATVVNPTTPALAEPSTRITQAAAHALGLELHVLQARGEHDFDPTFAKIAELRAQALIIAPDQLFTAHSKRLPELTLQHALPAIYEFRQFVAAGGLISYGSSETEYYRLVGNYVGRILKGDQPADLPVQQATKVELLINLRTANTLGITVPLPLSGRADELIE